MGFAAVEAEAVVEAVAEANAAVAVGTRGVMFAPTTTIVVGAELAAVAADDEDTAAAAVARVADADCRYRCLWQALLRSAPIDAATTDRQRNKEKNEYIVSVCEQQACKSTQQYSNKMKR